MRIHPTVNYVTINHKVVGTRGGGGGGGGGDVVLFVEGQRAAPKRNKKNKEK